MSSVLPPNWEKNLHESHFWDKKLREFIGETSPESSFMMLYHKKCLDGSFSAFEFGRQLSRLWPIVPIFTMAVGPKESFDPSDQRFRGKSLVVFYVDTSPTLEWLDNNSKSIHKVVIIDHHKGTLGGIVSASPEMKVEELGNDLTVCQDDKLMVVYPTVSMSAVMMLTTLFSVRYTKEMSYMVFLVANGDIAAIDNTHQAMQLTQLKKLLMQRGKTELFDLNVFDAFFKTMSESPKEMWETLRYTESDKKHNLDIFEDIKQTCEEGRMFLHHFPKTLPRQDLTSFMNAAFREYFSSCKRPLVYIYTSEWRRVSSIYFMFRFSTRKAKHINLHLFVEWLAKRLGYKWGGHEGAATFSLEATHDLVKGLIQGGVFNQRLSLIFVETLFNIYFSPARYSFNKKDIVRVVNEALSVSAKTTFLRADAPAFVMK